MSRGFVKEEDQEETPFIPARAVLPVGEINYTTPVGYKELIEERKKLEGNLAEIKTDLEKETRHERAILSGKLNLLNERIATARILDPREQPQEEVRFGAEVSFKFLSGPQKGIVRKFQLVGVDEADIKKNKIAFVAPIAKALTGKKVGETVNLSLGTQVQKLEILNIEYPEGDTSNEKVN